MLTLTVAAAAVTTLAACGGSGSDRPTTKQISASLKDGKSAELMGLAGSGLPDSVVDCMAKGLHDSKVSDKALQALIDGDTEFEASDSDKDAITDVSAKVAKCTAEVVKDQIDSGSSN